MNWKFSNDKPIYIQLVDGIELKIISGEYVQGSKILSIREMATEVGVNPNTVQKALAELERKNLIVTNRTNGKFITEDGNLIEEIRTSQATKTIKALCNTIRMLGYTKEETLQIIKNTIDGDLDTWKEGDKQ
ncbi:MAG: GntR family transcriptional regulator [Anaerovorax sp.]